MHTTVTGERIRLRPFASMDEGLDLVKEIHLGLIPGWGEQWEPLGGVVEEWNDNGWLGDEPVFAIERLDTGELVGYETAMPASGTRLTGLIATYIRDAHQGQGFGVEAKRLSMRYLFENYPVDNVGAITLSNHPKALRGLELCGMREEGRLVGCTISDGHWVDEVFFTITRKEWEARLDQPSG